MGISETAQHCLYGGAFASLLTEDSASVGTVDARDTFHTLLPISTVSGRSGIAVGPPRGRKVTWPADDGLLSMAWASLGKSRVGPIVADNELMTMLLFQPDPRPPRTCRDGGGGDAPTDCILSGHVLSSSAVVSPTPTSFSQKGHPSRTFRLETAGHCCALMGLLRCNPCCSRLLATARELAVRTC